MIKYKKLPKNIGFLLSHAETYLKSRSDIDFAYLFGSLAKKKITPLSDVDIAIHLSKDGDIAEKKMEILGRLMILLNTDEIDLVILNTAALPLKMKILENKKVIVDNHPFKRYIYESLIMRKYFDFAIKETGILERRFFYGG